jgi:hypothetical protein
MFLSVLLVMIRSMQDLSVPLQNVLHAGGPGSRPFIMCQPYYSQSSMSQGALEFVS